MAEIIGPRLVQKDVPATWMIDVPGAFGYSWTIQNGNIVNGQESNIITAAFTMAGQWHLRVDYITTAQTPEHSVIVVDTADDGKRN